MSRAHLLHFSEDPNIELFVPRVSPTQQVQGSFVWAVDTHREPTYWFPRECPRATWWPINDTETRVHAIQWDWWDAFATAELFVYRLPADSFARTASAFPGTPGSEAPGFWVSRDVVTPVDVAPVGSLVHKHRERGIELRVVMDLKALWSKVIARSGIDFSGIRLANLNRTG